MPRIDPESIFGRLLGWEKDAQCLIAPVDLFTVKRRCLPETTFINPGQEIPAADVAGA